MSEYAAVKDSGAREEFSTGSRRDTRQGKGRFDLMSPIVLSRLAKHLENGAAKYGDRNWEKGQPLSRYIDSALRHINKYLEGHRDEDHLSAALWNIGGIVHTEEMIRRGHLPETLNDLPNYLPKTTEKLRFFINKQWDGAYWVWDTDTAEGTFRDKGGKKGKAFFTPQELLVYPRYFAEVTEAEAKAHIGVKS